MTTAAIGRGAGQERRWCLAVAVAGAAGASGAGAGVVVSVGSAAASGSSAGVERAGQEGWGSSLQQGEGRQAVHMSH